MTTDWLGCPTNATGDVLAAVNDAGQRFVRYRDGMGAVIGAADANPDSALLNTLAAMVWMFAERPDAPDKARPYLARADAADGNGRERNFNAAVAAWSRGEIDVAKRALDVLLDDYPRDLVSCKLYQYLSTNAGTWPDLLRVALKCRAADDIAEWHAMAAFGYEQCHLIDDADHAARRGLAMNPGDPWAHHAIAHVHLTRGQIDAGLAFLDGVKHHWVGLNSFMHTHVWWHYALFQIARGDLPGALRVYDRDVWGIARDYSQDQAGAAGLLMRIEIAGGDVGERWTDLSEWLRSRVNDAVEPFLSLHYFLGLARAGRSEATALEQAIVARREQVWTDVARPMAAGIRAYVAGNWAGARAAFGQALPRFNDLGGSHAQRDVFQQLHLQAVVEDGGWIEAQQLAEDRRRFEPDGAHLNALLDRVYQALGLPEQAAQARARVQRRPKSTLSPS